MFSNTPRNQKADVELLLPNCMAKQIRANKELAVREKASVLAHEALKLSKQREVELVHQKVAVREKATVSAHEALKLSKQREVELVHKKLAEKLRAEELAYKAVASPWEAEAARFREANEVRKQIAVELVHKELDAKLRAEELHYKTAGEVNGRHDIVGCDVKNEKKGLNGNECAKESSEEKSDGLSDKDLFAPWIAESRIFEEKKLRRQAKIECPPPVEVNGSDATNDKVVHEKKGLNENGLANEKPVNLATPISEKSDGLTDKAAVSPWEAESARFREENEVRKRNANVATIGCPSPVEVNGCHDTVAHTASSMIAKHRADQEMVVKRRAAVLVHKALAVAKQRDLKLDIKESAAKLRAEELCYKAAVYPLKVESGHFKEKNKLRKQIASAATIECPPQTEVNVRHDIVECDATNDKVGDNKKGLKANRRVKKKPVNLATVISENSDDGLKGNGSFSCSSDCDPVASAARLAAGRKKKKNDQMKMQEQKVKEEN